MNNGKRFENNFKLSIDLDDDVIYYRLIDNASSFYGGNTQLRFSPKNICDNIMFYTHNGKSKLFFNELKATKGKSIPFGNIMRNEKDTRLQEMVEFSEKSNVVSLLIVFFSDVERCFALESVLAQHFIELNERKSIPISYFEENAFELDVKKLQVNHRFGVMDLLKHHIKN